MILDTNALSALADGDPGLEAVIQEAATLTLPVVVLGEYRYGIRHSRHRIRYEMWLAGLLKGVRILPIEALTTEYYSTVRSELRQSGTPIPSNDVWIAALARQHELQVLSKDRHFDAVPKLRRASW